MNNSLPRSYISNQQKRLWNLQRVDSYIPYQSEYSMLIEGELDSSLLRDSLEKIISQHEILNTIFRYFSETTDVRNTKHLELIWTEVELEDAPEGNKPAIETAVLNVDWRSQHGDVLEAILTKVEKRKCFFHLRLPALAGDANSLQIIAKELIQAYLSGFQDVIDFPVCSFQYSDYCVEKTSWIDDDSEENGLDVSFWQRLLQSGDFSLDFPFERPVTSNNFLPKKIAVELNAEKINSLRKVSSLHDISVEEFLFSCWQILVSKLIQQPKIIIGFGYDGRSDDKFFSVVGPFAKYLPVSLELAQDLGFSNLLMINHNLIREISELQDYFDWEQIGQTGLNKDLPMFFSACFDFIDLPDAISMSGTTFSLLNVSSYVDRFKLRLSCVSSEKSLILNLHYDSALLQLDFVSEILSCFISVLDAAISNPNAELQSFSLIDEQKRDFLLNTLNDTHITFSTSSILHELFEEQVNKTPDRIAVQFQDHQLSYAELNSRANRLARYLQTCGVGPDIPVALFLNRSLEMVIGLLAVLKAGGFYIPIDSYYPKERIDFMIANSKANIILTEANLSTTLTCPCLHIINLDTDVNLFNSGETGNLKTIIEKNNLAYVIYTSGSTGHPKGSMISHIAICNHMSWMQREFSLRADDCVFQKTPISFDASIWEFYAPLLAGARLLMAQPDKYYDVDYLINTILEQNVTILQLVPTLLRLILDSGRLPSCTTLKHVFCGGEPLLPGLANNLFSQRKKLSLCNLYGPTETSVDVTCYRIETHTVLSSVPIGRPIANTQIYILDESLQPVPIGMPGELYIGGDGLARGYLYLPELTAEKFLPNPFSLIPGMRLYRTGDLARWLPNGNIEFLGRIDNQVKLRGVRVELGEIEAVLRSQAGVNDAIVLLREDDLGEKRLVAYVVLEGSQVRTSSGLRHNLQTRLPEYMLPSAFVMLESLPLTPNGKVDRRALPAPDCRQLPSKIKYVAPRNMIEEIVAGIWAEILNLKQVGVEDNFFELGGHSLLATQVLSRIRRAFQVEVPLHVLFECPTIALLAQSIDRLGNKKQQQPIVQTRNNDTLQCLFPLSFTQERIWFIHQFDPTNPYYNFPIAIQLDGELNLPILETSIVEILKRHEVLRTTFINVDGKPVQVITAKPNFSFQVFDLQYLWASDQNIQVENLIVEISRLPFDLEQGPLTRITVVQLEEEKWLICFCMHHIISDAWSMDILCRELVNFYQALVANKSLSMPALPIQYADFAMWQREYLQGKILEDELTYWKQQLEGAERLDLPLDDSHALTSSHSGESLKQRIPKSTVESLKALEQQEGVTLYMILLAALNILLNRYTQKENIIVGSPIAGRNRVETEGLIGCFLNTLILRTDLSGNPDFCELLSRIRKVALLAYSHQEIPFEKVVEELHLQRDVDRPVLIDVMLNVINTPQLDVDVPGIKFTSLSGLIEPLPKFPIEIYIQEYFGELVVQLVYRHDMFSSERMNCFLKQYCFLLEQISNKPNTLIQTYSLVLADDPVIPNPEIVLSEPAYESLIQMLTNNVRRMSDQIAIKHGSRSWSYGELWARTHMVAQSLLTNGFKQGNVIAVKGKRGFGLIVSMVATLLVGGKLLTLDDRIPEDRQWTMLQGAGARYLLLIGPEQELVTQPSQKLIRINIDSISAHVDNVPRTESPTIFEGVGVSPDAAAYIFFTSGTTGLPKGILGSHKGLNHFVHWQRKTFNIGPGDHCSQLTSISFDVVLREIFLPLVSGATLHIPEEDNLPSEKIFAWLNSENITVLHTVPTLAQFWLANSSSKIRLDSLRWVFFAGEPLKRSLIDLWRKVISSHCDLINLYGPTETTLAKCYYQIPVNPCPGIQPVGWPLPETQVFVVSDRSRICGVGELGEIVIRTPFRSLGYINSSESNQKYFVCNPFRKDEQDILYFTGDQGRFHPNGMLEILGRLDYQVKLNGMRVNLEEVETLLGTHPKIQQAAVAIYEDGQGVQRFVAYIVPVTEPMPAASEVHRFLKKFLPDYMIPSAYLQLPKMPLKLNGKLDRDALPAPSFAQFEKQAYIEPRNEVEMALALIFKQFLKAEKIGVTDNFFALGGNSLIAIRVISRIKDAFGLSISLRCFFDDPTVSGLAQSITKKQKEEAGEKEILKQLPEIENLSRGEIDALLRELGESDKTLHDASDLNT